MSEHPPMLSAPPKDRLQPSLFDRLADELAPALAHLDVARGALEALLDAAQRAELGRLLERERADTRRPVFPETGILAGLEGEARSLLDRVLELERARRSELRRTVALSGLQLRAAVLRDLQALLNTTPAETRSDEMPTPLSRWPTVRDSVVNYGIPALTGRIYGPEDLVDLFEEIEAAIARHEPRLRRVRVRPGGTTGPDPGALKSPIDLVIEGEIWGYPVSERLLVHTVLDLDAGRVEVADRGQTT